MNLTDSTSSVVASYNYDAYGNTLSSTGSIPNPYGFSTKEFSSQSGLIYFGARYYNPSIGRWLSPDPLGMINGPNMYAYCSNNPTNLIDPWGLEDNGGNFPGGNSSGNETNTSGGNTPGKCPDPDQKPTNPDEDSQQISPWWGDIANGHRQFHQGIRNNVSGMNPLIAGWLGAQAVLGGSTLMEIGGTILGASVIDGPVMIIGIPLGGIIFVAGVEIALIGFDILIGASNND